MTQEETGFAGDLGERLLQELQPLRGDTNSPDSLTLLPWEREWDLPEGVLFENMEAFGLSHVCRRHQVPFMALYALTNGVGPQGSREWAENHRQLSHELQRRILEQLSPGR